MKSIKKRAVSLVMTAALLVSALLPVACSSRDAKDMEVLQDLTDQFIQAFGKGDSKEVDEMVKGDFSYNIDDRDEAAVLLKIASKTEIDDFKGFEFNRENNTAKVRVVINYIDIAEFQRFQESHNEYAYMTVDEYLDAVDSYKDLEEKSFTFNYQYDDEEGRWLIKKTTADKYLEMFNQPYYLYLVQFSPSEAADIVQGVFDGFAEGEFEQDIYTFDIFRNRVFDDCFEDSPKVNEAAEEFFRAYFRYIVDRGIEYQPNVVDPYDIRGYGSAPSTESILGYFSSEEHLIELHMAEIRSFYGLMDEDELWTSYYCQIYYDLAKQIPNMPSEEYYIGANVYPWASETGISFYFDLVQIYSEDVFWACENVDQKTDKKCLEHAAESLYLAGEITEEQYQEYLELYEEDEPSAQVSVPTNIDGDFYREVEWEGTEEFANQAVGVYEYIPSWSDGDMIYGISAIDQQGIYMHYSKEPRWLDTAGYYIEDGCVTVMLKYERRFEEGTPLEADWAIDGETVASYTDYYVEEDGTYIFIFSLSAVELKRGSTVEFRLWEEGHSHVIAYVLLTQT